MYTHINININININKYIYMQTGKPLLWCNLENKKPVVNDQQPLCVMGHGPAVLFAFPLWRG